jgi:hypothetical protein
MIGFNGGLLGKARSYSTTGANSGVWTLQEQSIANSAFAIGGAETTINVGGVNYRVHTFTTSGTLTVYKSLNVDYLVVAGGGGGGRTNRAGGGGGAGGVRTGAAFSLTPGAKTVTVGDGGAAAPGDTTNGSKGQDSVFSTITATGGGFGGGLSNPATGGSGGSGGGGGHEGSGAGGAGDTPSYSPPQGNNGGAGNGGSPFQGGGGGGAGAVGASGAVSSNGGIGVQSSIRDGTNVYYGGGGGAEKGNGTFGTGGLGGGGGGAAGTAGSANTGGGGVGGRGSSDAAGAGGSGIVIIRYPI